MDTLWCLAVTSIKSDKRKWIQLSCTVGVEWVIVMEVLNLNSVIVPIEKMNECKPLLFSPYHQAYFKIKICF